MKLDRCSFQAPHASPRLRLMETHIYLSSFSSSSLSSLNVSSALPLELEIHILAIFYHYLVSSFIIKCLSHAPARVGDVYFIYLLSLSSAFLFWYKMSIQFSHYSWRFIFLFIFLYSFLFIFIQIWPPNKTRNKE